MTALNLEDLETDFLDVPCMDVLGDTIGYKAAGRATFATIKGYVEHADALRDIGTGQVIDQDVTVEVLRVDVPIRPGSGARIRFPRITGATFKAVNARVSNSGTAWIFEVKEVV